MRHCLTYATLLVLVCDARAAEPPAPDAAAVEFCEKEIRPLFVEKCQKCHGEKKTGGGLNLTNRATLLKGGERGPAVVPGKPTESLLIKAVSRTGELKMPLNGKLSAKEVEILTRWVARGAVWPDSGEAAKAVAKYAVNEKQRRWWAFQPIRDVPLPAVTNRDWPRSDLDRFLLAELEKRTIRPATPVERRVLLRRTTFDVTGLPPKAEEVEKFLKDDS